MVCEMNLGAAGELGEFSFYEAVIHSHARLTYTHVGEVLEQGESDGVDPERVPDLTRLHSLYRVLRAARNRNIRRLYMSCLADNAKMQAIARKHAALLRYESGDVVGEILPAQPSYLSLATEAAEDRMGFIIAVLDLQARLVRAA